MNSLVAEASAELCSAGLGAELLSESYDSQLFGNATALFECGPLLLRFIRDRSQDTLEIASKLAPQQFFLFEDIEIAMGWRSFEEVIARRDVEPLGNVVRCVRARIDELNIAFPGNVDRFAKTNAERWARSNPFRSNSPTH